MSKIIIIWVLVLKVYFVKSLYLNISQITTLGMKLKREVGVLGLSANIVNIIIGGGIFVLPAVIAASLGAASIIAYLFCGFVMILVMKVIYS